MAHPARFELIRRYKDRSIERYLKPDELAHVSTALAHVKERGVNPYALAAIRLLLLTGMRKSEVLTLRRSWIDFEHGSLHLPELLPVRLTPTEANRISSLNSTGLRYPIVECRRLAL